MKINKDQIKKIFYPASFVLFIIIILALTSKTKTFKKTSETEPLIESSINTPQKNTNTNIISNITPATNLSPTDYGEAKILNNELIIGEKTVNIGEKINSYTNTKNITILESGDIYGENKNFFWNDLNSNITKKINIERIKPVVDFATNAESKNVYFLGNYNYQEDSSILYSYNLDTEKFTLIEPKTKINSVEVVSPKIIALISNKHQPKVNTKINFYETETKKYVGNPINTNENTYCYTQDQFTYYDFGSKDFKNISLRDLNTTSFNSDIVTDDSHFYCLTNTYVLIEVSESKTKFTELNLNFQITSQKEVKNTTEKVYIESFAANSKLVSKYLNKATGIYYLD